MAIIRGDRALCGKTILVTRPKEKSVDLMREIRRLGGNAILVSLTRLKPPISYVPLNCAIHNFTSFDAVVFTSESAVERFFIQARKIGEKLNSPRLLYAVGSKTAQALKKRGWQKIRVARERRAEGLLKIMQDVRGLKILIPRAESGREILPQTLRARGAFVSVPAVYRAELNPVGVSQLKKVSKRKVDAVIFASGRSVHEFVAALGHSTSRELFTRAAAVSIGPVTSQAIEQYGIVAVEARRPQCQDLISALKRHFARFNENNR